MPDPLSGISVVSSITIFAFKSAPLMGSFGANRKYLPKLIEGEPRRTDVDHSVTIRTKQRQILKPSASAWFQVPHRDRVMALNEPVAGSGQNS